jgi:hypothetical protein
MVGFDIGMPLTFAVTPDGLFASNVICAGGASVVNVIVARLEVFVPSEQAA